MQEALYLFCLGRSEPLLALTSAELEGDVIPLRLEIEPEIGAMVNLVDADWFTSAEAEQRMADPAWLMPRLESHHRIIERVWRHTPVLPVPFGTLFSGPQSLGRLIHAHRNAITRFLDQVTGREEWAVKVWSDLSVSENVLFETESAVHLPEWENMPPGRRYLQEQRLRGEVKRMLPQRLKDRCTKIAESLKVFADDWRERPKLPDESQQQRMLGNWALLIPSESTDKLTGRLDALNATWCPQGLRLEWSGPWPPYSFSPSLDEAENE